MDEYEGFSDQLSSHENPNFEQEAATQLAWQTPQEDQGQHALSSVIDPRLYGDHYNTDAHDGHNIAGAAFEDVSDEFSIDQSSNEEESSW
jgi:hypothetical protein